MSAGKFQRIKYVILVSTYSGHMKMKFLLITILFYSLSLNSKAQIVLKGVVYNIESKAPIELANVYISNSTKGTITDNKGQFNLAGIPLGRSELIVSCIGFETQTIYINHNTIDLEVMLKPKYEDLQTVVVAPYEKDGWKKWGSLFLEHFIGTTQFSNNCKLLNKEAIKFHYSKKRNLLSVRADERLIIENKALGYILKYDLVKFEVDFDNQTFLIQGHPWFEEMQTDKKSEQNKWVRNRDEAYYGSMLQFMRSLYFDKLERDHFEIRRIVPLSLDHNILVQKLVPRDSLIFKVDSVSVGFQFNNYLQVTYTLKELPSAYPKNNYTRIGYIHNPQISQLTLNNNLVKIYANGAYYDGTNLISSGYWGWSEKMANLLPRDYEPAGTP